MKIVASIMFLWLMNGSRIIYRSEFAGGEWERPGDDMSERFLLSGHRDSRGQLQMSGCEGLKVERGDERTRTD